MTQRCPCCKQIIPPARLFLGQPIKRRIYEFIAAHPEGVDRRRIIENVYADDINGGPEFANVISVHIKKMRPVLKDIGLTISSMRGRGSVYRLVEIGR